ncbi:MAG TPA: hypothetical protein VM597_29255 [Gemmataceae bacterium]|nr:hypothetical protein [Gemmataceae bacterium]
MARKRPKPERVKPTKAQVRARVEELLRIRLDGAELWDISEYVGQKAAEPGSVWAGCKLGRSQIYLYMRKVDALIAESTRGDRDKTIADHLAKRRNLYAKAVSSGDFRTALSVLRDEAELLALYPDPKADALAAVLTRLAALEKPPA